MEFNYLGLGWKVCLRKRRASYFLTLVKELVRGNALNQGDELYYYLIDMDGRRALLLFLDGNVREPLKGTPKSHATGLSQRLPRILA